MAKANAIFTVILTIFSLLLFSAIGINISPFLRGPAPYPPEWQWQYQFTNTLPHIWAPFVGMIILFSLWIYLESIMKNKKKKITKKIEFLIVIMFVLTSLCIELALLYFSRSGVSVLISRIILPGANGYFTKALSISDLSLFFQTFSKHVVYFPMRAADHPPFAILFFFFWNYIATMLLPLFPWVKQLHIVHKDIAVIWNSLAPSAKLGVLFSIGSIITLSTVWIIPLYFFVKNQWGKIAAIRVVTVATIIPGIILFLPLNDVFLPLFSIGSLCILQKGIHKNNLYYFFISGFLWSIGVFFSLSLIPVGIIFLLYIFSQKRKNAYIIFLFGVGVLLIPLVLFLLFRFNTFEAFAVITKRQAHRSYLPWIFYNLWDIFIFLGIPIALSSIWSCANLLIKMTVKKHILLFLTVITIIFLDISGFSRAEAGRIWLPLYILLLPTVIGWLTVERNFSTKLFAIFLFLQYIEILVVSEFWVTLW